MTKVFEIGDLAVQAGKKDKGWIPVAKTYYGELKVPIVVVNGSQDGKALFICGGVHGTEFVGTEAMLRLHELLDPLAVKGKVVSIPFLNVPAFDTISRAGPYDDLNLNRIFPGSKDGFVSRKLANIVVEEVFPKIDYVIDIHSGTLFDEQANICMFYSTEKGAYFDMAMASGIENLIDLNISQRGSLNGAARRKGIPNIALEVGGEGRCKEEWVQFEVHCLLNILKALGLIDGKPEGLPEKYYVLEGRWESANASGLFRPTVQLNSLVKKGQLLGTIVDFHGNVLEEIKSPREGKVLGLRSVPKIGPGEWAYWVGKPVKEYTP